MEKLRTPIFNTSKFKNVYEPSEDTFLFLDAIESEIPFIYSLKPVIVVEIGSGSGVIITALSDLLKTNAFCLATDISFEANKATKHTAFLNTTKVECIRMDLISSFKPNIFDIVLFNPPYVVTESDEIRGNGLNRAWAGGIDGREVIDKFLKILPNALSKKGICYMVVIKENKPDNIADVVNNLGLKCDIVKERKILGEHLFILKIANKS